MRKMSTMYAFYKKEILSKRNIIILSLFLIVQALFFYYSLNLGFEISCFEFIYIDYLNIYFSSTIRFVLITNSIIIPIILIFDVRLENKCLNILINKEVGSLYAICCKLLVTIKTILIYAALEFTFLIFMPIIFYPKFELNRSLFIILIYIEVFSIGLMFITLMLIGIFKNYFIVAIPVIFVIISYMVDLNITNYYIINYDIKSIIIEYIKIIINISIFDFICFSLYIFFHNHIL